MMMKLRLLHIFIALAIYCFGISIGSAFVVKQINVIGLYKIQKHTVLNALPIKIGNKYSSDKSKVIIRDLFNTGFFDDLSISHKDNTLIINVKERPTIARMKVTGNKEVSQTQVKKVFKDVGLLRGRMLNRSVLDRFKSMLISQYHSRGKLDVSVDTKLTPQSQNRVDVEVIVTEGKPTIIKKITFIGNKKISSRALRKQLKISTPGLLTFFTEKHKYSKEKLDESLQAVREYYLDRGYIDFKVVSSTVDDVPGKPHVNITIDIFEGKSYKVNSFDFVGNIVLPREQLQEKVTLKKGDVFSRTETLKTRAGINDLLADKGYTYSVIDVEPEVIEATNEVNLHFIINPGRPIYVRRIVFNGNHKTADYVLRRAFRQEEGSLLSFSRVQESLRQVRLLEYIDNVDVENRPVEGANNQVDLHVKVDEGSIATIQVSAGYGTMGVEFDAGVSNNNLFGTGKSGNFHFKNDSWGNIYALGYYNPFFTKGGIGHGANFYFQEYKPGRSKTSKLSINKLKVVSFATNKTGFSTSLHVPLSDNHSLNFGAGGELLHVKEVGDKDGTAPYQLDNYVKQAGKYYQQARFTAGWDRMSYDQLPFPTYGTRASLDSLVSFPISNKGVHYYKFGSNAKAYLPLFKGFILNFGGGINYGNGFNKLKVLPFFENYYAGGMSSPGMVRGFEAASLGPRDEHQDHLGGNFLVHGNINLILPRPISRDNLRFYLYLDAGNVYQTSKDKRFTGTKSGPIRFSTGVAVEWRTPFGPINFSIGFPLNKKGGDKSQLAAFDMRHGFV